LQARITDTTGVTRFSPPVTVHIRPANDDFADRIAIIGNAAVLHADGVGATLEPGEPSHGPVNWQSVWWTWTAPTSGQVTISKSSGVSRYILLDVYTGSVVTNLTLVTNTPANLSGTLVSSISFNAEAGTAYQVAVAGSFYDVEDAPINFNFTPDPASIAMFKTVSDLNLEIPSISHASRSSDSEFHFTLTGARGANYTVLVSTNLLAPISEWSTLVVTNLPQDSVLIQDPNATSARRFYRVIVGP